MKKLKKAIKKPHVADKHSQQKSTNQKRTHNSLPHQILDMQQVIGNQAVQRFVTNHEQNQIAVNEFSTSLPTIFRTDEEKTLEEKKTELQNTFKYPYNNFSLDKIEEVSGPDGIDILYRLLVTDLKLGYGDRFRNIWPGGLEEALSDVDTRGDRTKEKWLEGVEWVAKWMKKHKVTNATLVIEYLKDPSLLGKDDKEEQSDADIPQWNQWKTDFTEEEVKKAKQLSGNLGLEVGGVAPDEGKKLSQELADEDLLLLSEYYQREFAVIVFDDDSSLLFSGTWTEVNLHDDIQKKVIKQMIHAHPGKGEDASLPSPVDVAVFVALIGQQTDKTAILEIIFRDGDGFDINTLNYADASAQHGEFEDAKKGME